MTSIIIDFVFESQMNILFFLFQIQSSLKCLCSQLAQYDIMSQQLQEQMLEHQLKQQAAMQQAVKVNVTLPILEQHLKTMENRISTNFERIIHQHSQRERILFVSQLGVGFKLSDCSRKLSSTSFQRLKKKIYFVYGFYEWLLYEITFLFCKDFFLERLV